MNDLSYIPETFREAGNQVDINLGKLQNLLVTSNFAAQWEKEHDSGEADGPCWSMFLEGPIKEVMVCLSVSISEFKKTVFLFAPKGNSEKLSSLCSILADETIKLQDLLNLYEVAAGEEDESGHDKRVNWPALFNVLLDILTRIRATNEELWDKTIELIKPEEIIRTEGAKEPSVAGQRS